MDSVDRPRFFFVLIFIFYRVWRGRRSERVDQAARRLRRPGSRRGQFFGPRPPCSHTLQSTNPIIPTLQRAASQLTPKLDDLHADALSRLYTLKTFRDRLGPLCLPNVTLSERDCRVLATYLSRKGLCGFDGEVSPELFRRGVFFCEPKACHFDLLYDPEPGGTCSLTHKLPPR